MKLCFYQRISLALAAVFICVLALFFFTSTHLQSITQDEAEQQLHLGLAEHLALDSPLLKTGVYDYDALKNLFHTLMILGPNFEFYYLDPNGKVLTYSAEAGKVKADYVDLAPIQNLIRDSSQLPIKGDDPRNPGVKKIFSAAPVMNGEVLQGYLYVIIGGEIYDSILGSLKQNETLQHLILFSVLSLLFLFAALMVLFKALTSPLRQLSAEMDKVSKADSQQARLDEPEHQWQSDSHDEVQRLGSTFTRMLKRINVQFDQLQQIDSQRRVLLADLSHDLRTPLANLQGYIETLAINDDALDVTKRKRFIDISLKNARNLKHLIDQIFELAYLEGGQVTLNREPFPLGELLHDIAAKFALKAAEKSLTLEVSLGESDYRVFADIGKLERILTNLLENAIRHTPSHGIITLAVTPQVDKIRIDIRDTGVGISDKEIAFIFDARYQATNHEKDNCLHAGLGLAISKKLVSLLDSDLLVESQLGKGTCFSFELQVVPVS